MISAERKTELETLGYFIEDMGDEYGPEYEGQYRWFNLLTGEYQDWVISSTLNEAWVLADEYEKSFNCVE